VPYDYTLSNLGPPWPALSARVIVIGGVPATFAEAARAAEILKVSRTSAIAPVLRAAGSALAGCDYFGVAAPYMERARREPKTGRAGAAGRHVTKIAFIEAVSRALADAREEELAAGLAAFAADERYAVEVAREAVGVRERAYILGVRSSVRSAVTRAVASCAAVAGQFSCACASACGTGDCRFAAPPYRLVTAAALPGRFTRPANHHHAGDGFTEAGAVAQVSGAAGYAAGVQVWDSDLIGGQAA
jgi:hypothetical protein